MASLQRERVPQMQKCVLCVGLTTVDLITSVEQYPDEDSDQRGLSFRKQRGGNASNSCTVLRQLNTACEYLGVLPAPNDPEHRWLEEDFSQRGIQTTGCVYSDRPCPMATVIVSRQNGSRTIVYCDKQKQITTSDLRPTPLLPASGHPELSYQQFLHAVSHRLHTFSWVHFELRPNVEECVDMVKLVQEKRQSQLCSAEQEQDGERPVSWPLPTISVEIEKPELVNAERVMALADVVFISKDWAGSQGWTDMETAVTHALTLCTPHTAVICPWAESGAAAGLNGQIFTAEARAPGAVVDTLGAGDTFVGGFIHACLRGDALPQALNFACGLAAAKCTGDGFDHLYEAFDLSVSESSGQV